MKSPFQGWGIYDGSTIEPLHYDSLKKYALTEAKKLGGNIICVSDYHNLFFSPYFCSRLNVQIYHLKDVYYKELKLRIDSLKKAYNESIKNKVLVHIKNCISHQVKVTDIYFNDSLIYHYRKNDKKFNRTNKYLDFEFSHEGKLLVKSTIKPKLLSKLNDEIYYKKDTSLNLVRGKEYFICTYNYYYLIRQNSKRLRGIAMEIPFIKQINKDAYENDLRK